MSKKQLDELLGLEKFNPLKNIEKIKGGCDCVQRITVTTVRSTGPTVVKSLVREEDKQ
ncbi:hypothetical protein [Aquimarina agarilytica]|uniref:hypothetical protein n=1 Tax=Aquimarina agarilytica TaxID=1087449 RepID=UPI0002FC1386|nr:hypothetical protein [Aquimarina agarilytica]